MSDRASRAMAYVGMTRGRDENHLAIYPAVTNEAHPHHPDTDAGIHHDAARDQHAAAHASHLRSSRLPRPRQPRSRRPFALTNWWREQRIEGSARRHRHARSGSATPRPIAASSPTSSGTGCAHRKVAPCSKNSAWSRNPAVAIALFRLPSGVHAPATWMPRTVQPPSHESAGPPAVPPVVSAS